MSLPIYELFAIKYAERDARRPEHFIGGDPHDDPMPMAYFVWLARSASRTFVIDVGFGAAVAGAFAAYYGNDAIALVSEAWLGPGYQLTSQVNVVNHAFIDNLPQGAPIEVPCVVDADGARPVAVGALPAQCAALNRTFLSVVDLTVRAATELRPEHIRHALMLDPNTSATLDVNAIWGLADAMADAHADLLPKELRAQLGAP